jgi:hypothetical protein
MARAVQRRRQKLNVGLLVTALADMHVRNLAGRFDWIRFKKKDWFS